MQADMRVQVVLGSGLALGPVFNLWVQVAAATW